MVALTTIFAVAVDGLAFGIFLALLGVGITLVFGLGEVLNLAIGVFAVFTVLLVTVIMEFQVGLFPASVLAVLLIAAFGLLVDRTLLSLVYRSEGEERILLGIFSTLGLTVFLQGLLTQYFPSRYQLPLNVPSIDLGGDPIVGSSLVTIGFGSVVLAILFVFLRRTYVGKATRTVFQDERGARLVGVNPRRLRTLIFVLSVMVAGVAGLLFGIGGTVSVSSGFEFTVFALIVSIVGGVRNLSGAIASGIFLGLINQFANFFVGSYLATVILFGAAIIALLANPEVIM
jgi:branched-chain amino acid transport system permease protein